MFAVLFVRLCIIQVPEQATIMDRAPVAMDTRVEKALGRSGSKSSHSKSSKSSKSGKGKKSGKSSKSSGKKSHSSHSSKY
ncbi:hypothetical protein DPMN_065445 [Dreissena polymorpha]|uniref:Uncharacterized protein n=1 Tax=Dreissena polymorpha TaxID=45954 RepID=A0A9D4BJM3_DREPO|nr:hypothetical protein DPMN_065445 [Dreissena polymorpha]